MGQFGWHMTTKKLKLSRLGDPIFLGPNYVPFPVHGGGGVWGRGVGDRNGSEQRAGSRPRQPTQASPVAAPAPSYALPSPGGAELSNSSYAAWPVYLGVSGQGHPQGGGPPHLQGHRNRERKRNWGQGARQTPNYRDNPFSLSAPGWDPSTSAKHCSKRFPHSSSLNPHHNPRKQVQLLVPCYRRGN